MQDFVHHQMGAGDCLIDLLSGKGYGAMVGILGCKVVIEMEQTMVTATVRVRVRGLVRVTEAIFGTASTKHWSD